MAYQKGDIIHASDLNGFLTTVNNVYGVGTSDRGYGQTGISQPAVSVGDPILASHWSNLRNMIVICANHQNTLITNLPPSGAFAGGEIISAFEQDPPTSSAYELPDRITDIDTNRLNASNTSLSTATNVWTVTKGSSWSGSIQAEISVLWSNENNARYYFNSAGQIRIHGSQPGSTPQDTTWNNSLVNRVGTIKFGAHATTNTGSFSGGSGIGYYELTNSYQNIFTGTLESGGAYYSGDDLTIQAKRLNYVGLNGGNGNGVQFKIILNDSGTYYSAVTGAGSTFSFDNVKATTFLSGITSPTYSTVTPF